MSSGILPHHHGHEDQADYWKNQLEKNEDFAIVAAVLKQLGDSSRVRIFWLLCHLEECVINISALVNMSSPAVSHHLQRLKASGLVVSRREGKEVYYRASDSEESRLLHQVIEKIMEISCPQPPQPPEDRPER